MQTRPFVTYLKNQAPTPQLNAHGHGWLELPNGQLWNPATSFKFNVCKQRCSFWCRLLGLARGLRYGH